MDFVKLSGEIEERYRRYLRTTFYLRDPELRTSFDRALQDDRLSKGPYIEVTPAYRRGREPQALFRDLVGSAIEPKLLAAIDGGRPLYAHQEDAIKRVAAGRNVVVATGTGSGKTECFLYPILLHLYREHLLGTLTTQPGVRALVLYPMNALAYDQRDRLGRLHEQLGVSSADFRFSFGQYTGATPDHSKDSYRHAADVIAHRFPGERVLRDEMRATPPHILLTNFSMLEYQLLRPDDSPLFDGPHGRTWTFLVLDEAHQYRGTRGAEMSLLLRRLKQRLRKSGNDRSFRCIATSASLAGGDDDRAAVASFAASLFAEPFDAEDVILARTEDILPAGARPLPAAAYPKLCEAIDKDDPAPLAAFEERTSDSAPELAALSIAARAGNLLARDSRTRALRDYMAKGPREVREVADAIFQEAAPAERTGALTALADVLNRAEQPHSNGPFLSVRYHLLLWALEGAFIRYVPERQITLTPQSNKEEGGHSFELALCRECGQHYLVGRKVDDFLVEAVRDPSHDDFGVCFFHPVSPDQDEGEAEEPQPKGRSNLCVHCGMLRPPGTPPRCDHATHILVEEQAPADQHADQMQRCATCGYHGQDPVREVLHGGDGPHAVIATGLFECIDQDQKKILAFADSRQEAAYFAWYLDDTYQSVLRRSVLYRSLLAKWDREHEPLSLADLADSYRRRCASENLVDEAGSLREQRRRAWVDVYREFLTEETRLSLAGVGLIQWSIRWPSSFEPPDILLNEPWSLGREDALVLTFLLLDHFRRDRAVELDTHDEADLDWPSLDLFGSQRIVRLGPPGRQTHVASWNGRQGWRVQFLAKIMARKGHERDRALDVAEKALRTIWEHLVRFCDTQPQNQLLRRVKDGRRLNPNWWRVAPIAEDEQVYRCDTCNRIEPVAFRDICPRRGCDGRLVPAASRGMADNHYRTLYQGDLRGKLVVDEHTAQLTTERGREVQRDFQEGRINVLSCSTTFELGVDLGNLNTVFLRNVPPEPFNYVQRVGRAGRRAGSPGFAVTYCRRGPHDLFHFADPARLLSGRTKPPSISLQNERVAERHLAAVVLSAFFRHEQARFGNVGELLQDWWAPSFASTVRTFVENGRERLEQDFRAIFPPELARRLGVDGGSWASRVSGEESRLADAESEVVSDVRLADKMEKESRNAGRYQEAGWAQRRKATIADEDVLSFLSRKAVIPKYGFPVDVVELDTQRTGTRQGYDVTLARDLTIAIGEFAPTATLVAGKLEWQSYGLKKVPEREWERKKYRVCHRHNLMVVWNEGEQDSPLPCGDPALVRSYVIPKFGFVTSSKPPKPPKRRPTRLFTTRPYFLHAAADERGEIRIDGTDGALATIRKAIPGKMAVLSEGRQAHQFYVCNGCGAGFIEPQATHTTSWNSECRGTLARVSLGHEFVTDVVQIEFHLPPPQEDVAADYSGLGLGIATALLEGMADVVDVPSVDFSVTIGRAGSARLPVIVLYDAVPGGAGLVARIEDADVFRMSLEAAFRRVEGGCKCGENTSCYGCLRSYRNQFAHTQLKRGPVKRYLEAVLEQWKISR